MATVRTTVMIMMMVTSATVFGRFMAVIRLPFALANWAANLSLPVGMNVFIIKGVTKDIPTETVLKGIRPFLIALLVYLGLLLAFPRIVTFLLNLLG